ncbi:TetR family transcriptional regulator [Novosphingobium sp. ZW T3_23]|uniref:TetR family transcriptional regulator n=1 Tax=Novosphingobium sp. ZW T3_23 TaxID=3378084 RepID=UPI003851D5FD
MVDTKPVSERRMGPVGSENWLAMLDGAEAILREEGHAALSSRRVAEHIGVKQRLVYYYFRTMDDLIVATFRRLSERELKRLAAARSSDLPLREIWDVCIHTTDARLISEFMALAGRIDGLGKEVIHFIEEARRIQTEAISEALVARSARLPMDADALALLATSLALSLTREADLGVSMGHEGAIAVVTRILDSLEPV